MVFRSEALPCLYFWVSTSTAGKMFQLKAFETGKQVISGVAPNGFKIL